MLHPFATVILTVVLAIAFFTGGCADGNGKQENQAKANISAGEEDPAVWGKYYPNQYQTYLQNEDETKTRFGGSVRESHLEKKPYLRILYKGYGFGEDYNEERGHVYAVEDVRETKRITGKSIASCWNCKTPTAPKQIAEQGVAWYKKPFSEVSKDVKHPVTCWDCHDPKTMKLRVTRQDFTKGLKERGIDVEKASSADMRTYVCAQCHNEYYFDNETKEVRHPWKEGLSPQAAVNYYNKDNFTDWEHPQSGTKMIKMQHPEYEMGDGSVHRTAGVSCADCHMPYMRAGREKFSSHWWTSPLKNIEISCQPCHRQSTGWLRDRVNDIQNNTNQMIDLAGEENVRAIRAIEAAARSPEVNNDKLAEAREYHRRGQAYWDWVSSENSMGFHNPQKALHTLGLAINNARQAQVLASEAAGKPLNPSIVDIPKNQAADYGEGEKPGDNPEFPEEP